MSLKKLGALTLLVLIFVSFTSAQEVKVEPEQRDLLLATTKTSTMQEKLDEVAAQGFRVLRGVPGPVLDAEMTVRLERAAKPPDTYKYKVLATLRTSTMQKELNEAAQEGFRLVPRTIGLGGQKIVVLLERAPNADRRYEYRVLATIRISPLRKELAQATAEGFVFAAGMVVGQSSITMLLDERSVLEEMGGLGRYRVIMEKESPRKSGATTGWKRANP